MHRTQISLEPEQYRRLGDEARRRGISLAALIRDLIDNRLGRSREPDDDPLEGQAGVVNCARATMQISRQQCYNSTP